ncbi:unnamed protein product, partial [Phaeothamnion confervicola]
MVKPKSKAICASWECGHCTFKNSGISLQCEVCLSPKASAGSMAGIAEEDDDSPVICPACTFKNKRERGDAQWCMCCGQLARWDAVASAGGASAAAKSFECTSCTLRNPPGATFCEACRASSPAFASGDFGGSGGFGDDGEDDAPARGTRSGTGGMQAALLPRSDLAERLRNGDGDDATTTRGLLPRIAEFYAGGTANVSGGWSPWPKRVPAPAAPLANGAYVQLVSPAATHVSQRDAGGAQWSCGYRNIQMLCSTLMALPPMAAVLFDGAVALATAGGAAAPATGASGGGLGKVPGVLGLQQWIEAAWAEGFDPEGCEQLGGRGALAGSTTWIGATECATLLRFFGIRAEVIDFEA